MDVVVTGCREAFNTGRTRPLHWRMSQLKNFLRMFEENEAVFCSALAKDLRKPLQESICFEVEFLKNDVRGTINGFENWTQDNYVEKNILTLCDQTFIKYDPLGVVLVMGAWNYPLQLALAPVSGAIAAGNCVIVKPSELSPATADAMAELIPKYLDPDCFKVVLGGVPETTELLKQKFDYIFFTGSTAVGRIVGEAANKHLTPVTLELGGKSPVYICESADLVKTTKRLIWAKCINLGQTCIAPDYVLCTPQVQQKFVEQAKCVLKDFYGEEPQKDPNLCRIINRRNFERLADMLKQTRGTVHGGRMDVDDLFIEPTLVTGVTAEDSTMESEIFGPILPIITVQNKEEAVEFINSRDKPLTVYVFTAKQDVMDSFKTGTTSGSMVINDAIVHLSVDTLPFGGVGASGMGAYHGKYTFQTFSHQKSVLVRDFSTFGEYLGVTRYPPYSLDKIKRMQFLVKNRKIPDWVRKLPYFASFVLGVLAGVLGQSLAKKFNLANYLANWF